MTVVEFAHGERGRHATGKQHFVFIDQQTHAMRLGWYNDEYVRTADGWRIRRRSTTFMRKHGGFDSGVQHDPLADAPSEYGGTVTELPKIISVDDHIVEPAHLWQERLPAKHARAGTAGRAGPVG